MSFFRKNKFFFDILATIVLAAGSVLYWLEYTSTDGKKMDLITAIATGLLAIIKLTDIIEYIRKKKSTEDKK